ncbi:NodT family RND efflux system outer membrane lipoprotein [Zymomonas mobilis subsp. mobilis ZM4 = ATCC 31821]|uniref:RND efflux system, outer membrane lipoprotein, NodT family n=1 Tax=Zymomonas mobilis subsp. mobilis (strain ATCC 31821 / ZM4 / CP4) TaxID=264203 RepID=Q5NNX2_ZYMMO|nr:efflux transporter outer membrane subunit [Zymomonas mobilis]AAV89588.1 RND efflux system, outer membrane lipoprotein, NodT family [Zymomonas mobilis subsp. mobilis ZM4 = ATCC 31821]AHB09677.1 efflux transporter, outer membrane factor lipoprotein, NodT family [Zymomonas mobilis subsp. mobilis str. CP4 = NRRL B-14023]AHJ69982.1 Multidrug resistance outer membrane protein MdtP precursor [Zymomonas mobilis subsp. mobilis NRRL B-12526]AHJ71837.1 Multidrug resistance outer membrane protein MdtP p
MHLKRPLITSISVAALLLTGCASIPKLGKAPKVKDVHDYATAQSLAGNGSAWPGEGWWKSYGDPQLDQLMTEALAKAPDMAIAKARILSAAGSKQRAGAGLLPSVNGFVGTGAGHLMRDQEIRQVTGRNDEFKDWGDGGSSFLTIRYNIDIWGGYRAKLAAATSEAKAAIVDSHEAALTLTTSIAAAYANLSRLFEERQVLNRTLAVRSHVLELTQQRLGHGLDNDSTMQDASARLANAQADLTANQESIDLVRHQIAALMGAGPDRGMAITRPQSVKLRAVGLPDNAALDLLGRRPDIVAARLTAEAAGYRVKVAKTQFYPNVSLNGIVGYQTRALEHMATHGLALGAASAALNLPIFRGGSLSGQYREAWATYQEAVASYDKTLSQALQQVADAATSQKQLNLQLDQTVQALNHAELSYNVLANRYKSGLVTYIEVLQGEENVLTLRKAVADLRARAFQLDVSLIQALGGGFTAA